MDQFREGPGTGSRRGRFASQPHAEDRNVALTGDEPVPPPVAGQVARALATELRVRELPTVTDPDEEQKYGLRISMGMRRRPFALTAHHDGSFTVTKESTAQSGNPYRAEALSTRHFRFDDAPTPTDLAAEVARALHAMRPW